MTEVLMQCTEHKEHLCVLAVNIMGWVRGAGT